MTRSNDDLTAEPLTDEEMAHLEVQLRRDVLRPRDTWLALLARCRAAEHALTTVRAQPKRDELAREVQRLEREIAGLELRLAQRDLAANTAEAYLAQARVRLAELQIEQNRVLSEQQDERWQRALTREEVRRLHQVDVARVQAAASLREADLQARLERAERARGDFNKQQTLVQALQEQLLADAQRRARWLDAVRAAHVSFDELFASLERD